MTAAAAQTRSQLPKSAQTPADEASGGEVLALNVAEIVRLEQRDRLAMSRTDQVANWLAAFSGRVAFAMLHAAIFAVWILWNGGWLPLKPFDA